MDTVKVKVTGWGQTGPVPLTVNGRRVNVPVGVVTDLPVSHLDALRNSSARFEEIKVEPPKAEKPKDDPPPEADPPPNADGDNGDDAPPPADPANVDLSILDGAVTKVIAALEGKSPGELKALLEAEKNGKTRQGVVHAIEKALAKAAA